MAGYIGANTSSVTNNQNAAERRKKFTFTANTTVLSGLNFAPEKIHIFHNGIRLVRTTDYTEASDGKSVTLVNAAQAGDEVVAVTFAQDPASNAGYTDADVDAHLLTAGVTLDATNDRVGFGTSSPVKKIHIDESTAAGEGILLTNSNNVAGTYSDLKWQYSGADTSYGSGFRFKQVDTTHGGQLEFYTDNSTGTYTKQMQITENGEITKPNQPSFRAGSSGGISTGSSVSTLVLPNVHHNVGNHYNNSNYTFTCPVAGIYYFGFHGNVRDVGGNAATSFYAQIMKNGNRQAIYYETDHYEGWNLISGSIVLNCAANDAILVSSGANAYWDSSDWTQFYGYLLG